MPTGNPNLGSEGLDFGTGIADGAAVAVGQGVKRTTTGDNTFEPCDTEGERPDGFAWEPAADGEAFSYVKMKPGSVLGRGVAGAEITAVGSDLTVDEDGYLIETTTPDDAIAGKSRTITAGAAQWLSVELTDGNEVVPTP